MESSIPAAKSWRQNKTRTQGWQQKGELMGWSVVINGPVGMEKWGKYIVGIVKLDKGEKIMTQIVDVTDNELFVGMRCVGVLRRMMEVGEAEIICYGVCFARERMI